MEARLGGPDHGGPSPEAPNLWGKKGDRVYGRLARTNTLSAQKPLAYAIVLQPVDVAAVCTGTSSNSWLFTHFVYRHVASPARRYQHFDSAL